MRRILAVNKIIATRKMLSRLKCSPAIIAMGQSQKKPRLWRKGGAAVKSNAKVA